MPIRLDFVDLLALSFLLIGGVLFTASTLYGIFYGAATTRFLLDLVGFG